MELNAWNSNLEGRDIGHGNRAAGRSRNSSGEIQIPLIALAARRKILIIQQVLGLKAEIAGTDIIGETDIDDGVSSNVIEIYPFIEGAVSVSNTDDECVQL